MKKSKYINATQQKNSGPPPVWFMRQAGRYLPEYRKIREKNPFLAMVKNPSLACEITLQPIKRFGFDAAILFSDILNPIECLGYDLKFKEKIGPVIENPYIKSPVIPEFKEELIGELNYVFEAIKLIKTELKPYHCPLIGFAGAPFTVFSYIVEGGSSQTLKNTKMLLYNDPHSAHKLLKELTKLTTCSIFFLFSKLIKYLDAE